MSLLLSLLFVKVYHTFFFKPNSFFGESLTIQSYQNIIYLGQGAGEGEGEKLCNADFLFKLLLGTVPS